jgi:hypothetical protein
VYWNAPPRRHPYSMRAFLLFLLLLALSAFVLQRGLVVVPDRHLPWMPLDVRETPGWLARYKFARAASDPVACRAALATSGIVAKPIADRETNPRGCGWRDAVRVERGAFATHEPFTASCPLALAYALAERHAIEPAAREIYGVGLRRIEHYGSYACRNIGNAKRGRLSEHARANALDLAAFVLDDGRRIAVAQAWRRGNDDALFLHEVHDRTCRYANVVLGPEYNAAHADHFHLDMGGFLACR